MKNQFLKLFSILLLSPMFVSCKHFNGYTISGTIKNAENVKVYLEDILSATPVIIDTATIHNNTFKIKNYSTNGIYRLRFGEEMNNAIFLYIAQKDKIILNADLKNLSAYTVEGSKPSTSLQQLLVDSKKYFTNIDSTLAHLKVATPSSKDSLQTMFNNQKKEYVQYIKNFIDKEPNNDVACFALNYLGPMLQEEIPYVVDIIEKLHTAAPDSKYIASWYQQTQEYRKAMLDETEGGVALNTFAPNIIITNPNGDTIQLKDLKGNYVLLDFWASWCQPCRMENPNVVAMYNKYHAQGFEVFSVSLDANADKWKQAIAKDGLVWKNHGCDFGGWQSAAAQLYHIESIPTAFLLDKQGKVIAKNLRGDALAEKLKELFPEKIN